MTTVLWDPDEGKPVDASALEQEIERIAPDARVKITLVNGEWRVRALNPAAMCARGADLSGRDVSDAVAQVLVDHDYPAQAFRR